MTKTDKRSDTLPPKNSGKGKQALVLGDAMVDTYIQVESAGISDEAPVTVVDWCGIHRALGGMMNVAVSLQTLGLHVHTIGLANENDEAGIWLKENAAKTGLNSTWFSDNDRPTIEKARVVANHNLDYLARLDNEQTHPIANVDLLNQITDCIKQKITESDVVVISDYAKGFINKTIADAILKYAQQTNCPVIVDAKPVTFSLLKGATLFTPNIKEAREFFKLQDYNNQTYYENTETGINWLGNEMSIILQGNILLTRNKDGMTLFTRISDSLHIPCADTTGKTSDNNYENNNNNNCSTILSTSGAGDVVLAVMAYGVATDINCDLHKYAKLASKLVARTIVRPGTCTLLPDDIAKCKLTNY